MRAALDRFAPRREIVLYASLRGVDGFTGTGVFRYVAWSNFHVGYETWLKGVAGRKAELAVRDGVFAELDFDDGGAFHQFDSRRSGNRVALAEGETVEIRQNGVVVMTGVLTRIGR